MSTAMLRPFCIAAMLLLFGPPASHAAPATPAAAQGDQTAARKEADTIYQTRCIGCHGPTGKGDGAVGAVLQPKPRDLGDAAWQKAVSDEHIEKIILNGGPAVGMSPLMPSNSDLANKPEVLKALRQMVRDFSKAKPAAK